MYINRISFCSARYTSYCTSDYYGTHFYQFGIALSRSLSLFCNRNFLLYTALRCKITFFFLFRFNTIETIADTAQTVAIYWIFDASFFQPFLSVSLFSVQITFFVIDFELILLVFFSVGWIHSSDFVISPRCSALFERNLIWGFWQNAIRLSY